MAGALILASRSSLKQDLLKCKSLHCKVHPYATGSHNGLIMMLCVGHGRMRNYLSHGSNNSIEISKP
ncbi:hypothetical protein TorRG33x02_290070 [Trema orientale]|uniref:Uncharacterized protein n=1 Tax=Trema orientale TaxID=63057 RepID=A0A2P5CCL8_TREOI|nr:hypothetical protein TorRG33x02_290070 [Trema orientale]